jgi:hypothetical protein
MHPRAELGLERQAVDSPRVRGVELEAHFPAAGLKVDPGVQAVGPGLERQEAALAARLAAAMRPGQLGPDSAAARGLELGMRL